MSVMPEQLKLHFKNEVFLRPVNLEEESNNSIIYQARRNDVENSGEMVFEVINAGDDVKSVKIGDWVIASWMNCVPAFELLDGKRYTITKVENLMAVTEPGTDITIP